MYWNLRLFSFSTQVLIPDHRIHSSCKRSRPKVARTTICAPIVIHISWLSQFRIATLEVVPGSRILWGKAKLSKCSGPLSGPILSWDSWKYNSHIWLYRWYVVISAFKTSNCSKTSRRPLKPFVFLSNQILVNRPIWH